ncbi:MAG TPA: NAD(+) synthase [Candidatus Limnocylindria bacterium]|nr:NAD(+) synthase [Candidatus Limnocylindria bacterium]
MTTPPAFSADVLSIDAARATEHIAGIVRDLVGRTLRRRGVVLGLSGGVDSSVAAALCVRALGPERVLGVLMPETDSSPDSTRLGRLVAETLGITSVLEDIGPILAAAGCYRRRDDAIRSVVPEYDSGYRCKIVLPDLVATQRYPLFSVVVQSPGGMKRQARLTAEAYLGIVAATNFKQRVRTMIEYYHADRLQFAVVGTPNRLEYDQGFFVKHGDGAADIKPIAHLYKSQVYMLGRYLGIPDEVQRRPPTTDTYSLEQSQEEFYFALPLAKMDLALYARNHDVAPAAAASALDLSAAEVERVYRMIDRKRQATRYQHLPPLLVEEVEEVPA